MPSLENCSALQLLQLDDNRFGGVIPRHFGNMSSLLYLTMSRNIIHGTIPAEISQLHSLQELSLSQNRLTGEIPDSIGKLEVLNVLSLNENQLSGKIPSCVGNLTMLTKLSLGANNLHGSIPLSLGNIKFLSLLNLSRNHLSGDIPKEIFQLSEALLQLDLSRNHITGPLAPVNNIIRLKNLVYLCLSNNNLSEYATGSKPSTYGDMYSYGILVLETFTGKCPTDEIFKDSLNLHDFVKRAIPEQMMNVCDPTLLLYLENGNGMSINCSITSEKTMECLCSVLQIGIACSMESAEARIDIANVLKELHLIRDVL
ncbi:hypothetical protein K7X08_015512 [Anisodus acutangulus]|uniref:Disease resistance R13L4/SHOC-2-like LRR domain-containing protein n=1 Tax=Anisodus acutangulus TaxID=402998 RepID=A0A9Q1QWS0_9SOLA|nr:hypothetical protein K7X08_015512 [Anisodus acutangulus]